MSDWTDSLQQASFRGLPFGVLSASARFGRRLAVHEYPNRDTPWAEDLGRGTRRFTVQGFLVTDSAVYGGGDVIAQREAMIGAAETAGTGDLVHPTYGRLTVTLQDLDVAERWDEGRYFELTFTFIEGGDRQFPSAATATGDAVSSAADSAGSAIAADFQSTLGGVLPNLSSLAPLIGQAAAFGGAVQTAANDATSLFHVADQLAGNFGRFAGGGSVMGGISSLIATATGLREVVGVAANDLQSVMGTLGVGGSAPTEVASAAAALTGALRAAATAPADGVRLLSQLAAFGR